MCLGILNSVGAVSLSLVSVQAAGCELLHSVRSINLSVFVKVFFTFSHSKNVSNSQRSTTSTVHCQNTAKTNNNSQLEHLGLTRHSDWFNQASTLVCCHVKVQAVIYSAHCM